jgi:hypothetical protein
MWETMIVINAFLLLVGCAIATYFANGVRGSKLKRFTLATLNALLLSWIFYAFDVGHGPGVIVGFKPAVFLTINMLMPCFKSSNVSAWGVFLAAIPVFFLLAIFACFWWFSRWRVGELDYFSN